MTEETNRIKQILDSAIIPADRETVGKIASDLMQKTPDSTNPIELEREMQRDYISHLVQCAENGKKTFHGDFFLVVLTKREKLMPNVFRNYFTSRTTCPLPNYDQSVFRYVAAKEDIEYIWSIPGQETCHYLKSNALEVVPEERQLLDFILQFADGSLTRLAKKLNGEEIDSPLLIK